MQLFTVYSLGGAYIGQLSMHGICWLFIHSPSLWLSIHGGTSEDFWAGIRPSGEFNRSSWDEWMDLYAKHVESSC